MRGMGVGGSPVELDAFGRDPASRHVEMMEVREVVARARAHQRMMSRIAGRRSTATAFVNLNGSCAREGPCT